MDRSPVPSRPLADILIVDDHPGCAGSTANVLRWAGLSVLTASTIDDALDLCHARRFGAIILDRSVAGTDVLFQALAQHPTVIILSGGDAVDVEAFRSRHSGQVLATIRKPAPPLKLLELVKAAVAVGRSRANTAALSPPG
jgi:DNA-binding NtrC family response regulator